MGETDITLFSTLTGDWHPQHSDAVWAESSIFGQRIAHGLLIISLGSGLLPLDPERVVALRAIRDAVFKRPVRIGDTVRAEAVVADVQPLDAEMAVVGMALRILNQDRAVTIRARLELLWRRPVEDHDETDAD